MVKCSMSAQKVPCVQIIIKKRHHYTDLPEWVSLLRENLEVFLSELDGRQSLQPEVGPTLDKLHQRLKGVQTQPVVAVVRQVSHENADLD